MTLTYNSNNLDVTWFFDIDIKYGYIYIIEDYGNMRGSETTVPFVSGNKTQIAWPQVSNHLARENDRFGNDFLVTHRHGFCGKLLDYQRV